MSEFKYKPVFKVGGDLTSIKSIGDAYHWIPREILVDYVVRVYDKEVCNKTLLGSKTKGIVSNLFGNRMFTDKKYRESVMEEIVKHYKSLEPTMDDFVCPDDGNNSAVSVVEGKRLLTEEKEVDGSVKRKKLEEKEVTEEDNKENMEPKDEEDHDKESEEEDNFKEDVEDSASRQSEDDESQKEEEECSVGENEEKEEVDEGADREEDEEFDDDEEEDKFDDDEDDDDEEEEEFDDDEEEEEAVDDESFIAPSDEDEEE